MASGNGREAITKPEDDRVLIVPPAVLAGPMVEWCYQKITRSSARAALHRGNSMGSPAT
jgi:hypothetical protein